MSDVRSCGGNKSLNGGCDDNGVCLFYKFRMNRGRPSVKLIRKMCLWCMGGSSDLVRDCITTSCPIHIFRFGTNPNISEETSILARERVIKNRFSFPV